MEPTEPMSYSIPTYFSWTERLMLRRFHPRRIFIDGATLPWLVYFIWRHDWIGIAATIIATSFLGYVATAKVDERAMAKTTLGKLALLHLEPSNVGVQIVGMVMLAWGIWDHSTIETLMGSSVVFLGHLSGWDRFYQSRSEDFSELKAA